MISYRYKGKTADGVKVSGVIDAFDEAEAVAKLQKTCALVTKIEQVEKPKENFLNKPLNTRLKERDLAILCSQFSILLASGMTVLRCLQMMASQTKNKQLRKALEKTADDIGAGVSLADSFEKNKDIKFPSTFVETVRAGEKTGSLVECLKRLKTYYERSASAKAKISGALTYPLIVIATAVVVVAIVMVKAVPAFTQAFLDLGAELPLVTKALISTSNFFVKWWWVMAIILATAAIIYLGIRRTEQGKIRLASFEIEHSPLKKLRKLNAAGQFATTLSAMLASGLPMTQALTIAGEVSGNYIFTLSAKKVREGIERGHTIAESMADVTCFPPMLSEMIGVGENSGSLVETLDVVGDFFTSEVENYTKKMISIMEPAITIGLALIVMVLLLAVYLPMFSMYGSMSNM